jgi:hypothetical protein
MLAGSDAVCLCAPTWPFEGVKTVESGGSLSLGLPVRCLISNMSVHLVEPPSKCSFDIWPNAIADERFRFYPKTATQTVTYRLPCIRAREADS